MIYRWLFIVSVITIVLVVILLTRFVRIEDKRFAEKNTRLKKQMTSNIAHELRTPVTSIRGYLETLLSCPDLPQDKKQVVLERAYNQTLRLSELISDMALISKMEERSSSFDKVEVDLFDVANEVFFEFDERIAQHRGTVEYGQTGHQADSSGTGHRRENDSVYGVVPVENGRRGNSGNAEGDRPCSLRHYRQTGFGIRFSN